MSSSDVRMLEELTARVVELEARVGLLGEQFAAVAGLLPKDMAGELYGPEADHAADRAERAALVKRPPRPKYALGAAPEDQVP